MGIIVPEYSFDIIPSKREDLLHYNKLKNGQFNVSKCRLDLLKKKSCVINAVNKLNSLNVKARTANSTNCSVYICLMFRNPISIFLLVCVLPT